MTDLQLLNQVSVRKPWPLPKIVDIFQRMEGFVYITLLDLVMGYYTLPLDEESQRICTAIFPWGKYQYCRLPMGWAGAPDCFQAAMDHLFGHLPFVICYLDDLAVITRIKEGVDDPFQTHLNQVTKVLEISAKHGLSINGAKSSFFAKEAEYLGYKITQKGIRPVEEKVKAILQVALPKNRRQLRRFLGMLQIYQETYRRRSQILAPLTAMTSTNVKFNWTEDCQRAFTDMKKSRSDTNHADIPRFQPTVRRVYGCQQCPTRGSGDAR